MGSDTRYLFRDDVNGLRALAIGLDRWVAKAEAVVIVVNNYESFDVTVRLQPRDDLFIAWTRPQIRQHAAKGNS